jgi:hypothetical protein
MAPNAKLVLIAALGLIPSCLYWLIFVQTPARKRKELADRGGARGVLAERDLREASLKAIDSQSFSVGGMTLSSIVKFHDLKSLLSQGIVNAVDVHTLFHLRASVAHNKTHCLVGFITGASKIAEVVFDAWLCPAFD